MAENGATNAGADVSGADCSVGNGSPNDNGTDDFSNGHPDEQLPEHQNNNNNSNNNNKPRLSEAAQKYMQDLLSERVRLENHFPFATKLIDEALERVQLNGRIPAREQYADVYQQRAIKLTQKVHVPIKDKKFNYVGKLLGPKGNSLRRLQEETQCKIVILGRFSMKDRVREEELRNSSDAKYAHLNLPLHVEVSTIAPPAEAYARVAYALAELRPYLIPDKHDDIRQEQFRELMEDPEAAKKITIRQHQQQANMQHARGAGNFAGGGNGGNPAGAYRPKYPHHQSPNYHHNNETVHYRPAANNYHQTKPYIATQRAMPPPPPPPQAMMSGATTPATPAGLMPPYSGRATNGMGGNVVIVGNNAAGGNSGAGAGGANMRYRPPQTYKYTKNK